MWHSLCQDRFGQVVPLWRTLMPSEHTASLQDPNATDATELAHTTERIDSERYSDRSQVEPLPAKILQEATHGDAFLFVVQVDSGQNEISPPTSKLTIDYESEQDRDRASTLAIHCAIANDFSPSR